jgi:hypothetical protein
LTIACAMSAAKSRSWCSVPGGNGSSGCVRDAVTTPQILPSTTIGAPIDASRPSSAQRRFANSVCKSAAEFTRAGAAVSTIRAVIVSPPKG